MRKVKLLVILRQRRELEDLEKVKTLASLLSTMVDMQMTRSRCSQSKQRSLGLEHGTPL